MDIQLTPPRSIRSAIFAAYEAARKDYEPIGINVGDLGNECDRAIFYSFRYVSDPEKPDGRKLRLFATGNIEEQRVIDDLLSIGCEIIGEQERVRLLGGHVRGKIDGEAMGVPEDPEVVHLVECKSANDKSFKDIQKNGVEKSQPKHYGQCQMYMHGRGLPVALYVVVNKNNDDIYTERVAYDAAYCERVLARVESIILAEDPPPRVSENQKIPPCLFCPHKGVCHGGDWPRKNCRTCVYAVPDLLGDDADWGCRLYGHPLSLEAQKAGCPSHLFLPGLVPGRQVDHGDRFIPSLVPAEQIDVDEADNVIYRPKSGETWVNGNTA